MAGRTVGYLTYTYMIFFLIEIYPRYSSAQLAISPWPMFGHDARHTGQSAYNGPQTDSLLWTYAITDSIYGSSPIIGSDGNIYIASCYGDAWGALNAFTSMGFRRWSCTVARVTSSPAIGSDGRIYVGTNDKKLFAFTSIGSIAWTYKTGDYVQSSPAIDSNGKIVLGSLDGRIYAVTSSGALSWSYRTNGWVRTPPAIGSDGHIYIGSFDNRLYALTSTGLLSWSYDTGTYLEFNQSAAISASERVYVGSQNNRLYALTSGGAMYWSYDIGNTVSCPAIGSDDRIYVGTYQFWASSYNGRLYALTSYGSLSWTYDTWGGLPYAPALGSDGMVYVGSDGNILYALDSGGKIAWLHDIDNAVGSSPTISSDCRVYVGAVNGRLYAYNNQGSPAPTPGPTRTPTGPTPTPTRTPTRTPTALPPPSTVKIILDTDLATDCDDLGALAMLHAYADQGKAEILAMVCNVSDSYSPLCLDAINTYYGRPDIAIGTVAGIFYVDPANPCIPLWEFYPNRYAYDIANTYEHDLQLGAVPDAVEIYRQKLDESNSGVTIISIGSLYNLARLLSEHYDLVRNKVAKLVVMGGAYPNPQLIPDYNFSLEPHSSQYVVASWPSPIIFTGLGSEILTGTVLFNSSSVSMDNPVREGYDLGTKSARIDGTPAGSHYRPSWDQIAVLYAVEGPSIYFTESETGVNIIFTPAGYCTAWNVFSGGEGNRRYLKYRDQSAAIDAIGARISDLMATPIRRPLGIQPSALKAGEQITLNLSLTEDITRAFDLYLIANTPYGPYTIFLNGRIMHGIKSLYRKVPGYAAPYSVTIKPKVKIPLSMKGATVSFYLVAVEAGKIPPVSSLQELGPRSPYVITFDKWQAVVK